MVLEQNSCSFIVILYGNLGEIILVSQTFSVPVFVGLMLRKALPCNWRKKLWSFAELNQVIPCWMVQIDREITPKTKLGDSPIAGSCKSSSCSVLSLKKKWKGKLFILLEVTLWSVPGRDGRAAKPRGSREGAGSVSSGQCQTPPCSPSDQPPGLCLSFGGVLGMAQSGWDAFLSLVTETSEIEVIWFTRLLLWLEYMPWKVIALINNRLWFKFLRNVSVACISSWNSSWACPKPSRAFALSPAQSPSPSGVCCRWGCSSRTWAHLQQVEELLGHTLCFGGSGTSAVSYWMCFLCF